MKRSKIRSRRLLDRRAVYLDLVICGRVHLREIELNEYPLKNYFGRQAAVMLVRRQVFEEVVNTTYCLLIGKLTAGHDNLHACAAQIL